MSEGIVFKSEWKHKIQADTSMLKEENKVIGTSGFGCHLRSVGTTASCIQEEVCYALDISTLAVNSEPSNPVTCFIKSEIQLPSEGIFSRIWSDI